VQLQRRQGLAVAKDEVTEVDKGAVGFGPRVSRLGGAWLGAQGCADGPGSRHELSFHKEWAQHPSDKDARQNKGLERHAASKSDSIRSDHATAERTAGLLRSVSTRPRRNTLLLVFHSTSSRSVGLGSTSSTICTCSLIPYGIGP
jgi:hypothetical protein